MLSLQETARSLALDLTPRQLEQFEQYYHLLLEWNSRINLTAITGYGEVHLRHFADSLSVALAFPDSRDSLSGQSLLDVGAGAGFPGLPLAIAFPELRVTLLEATGKKVAFLEHVISALGLTNATALNGRAEEWAHKREFREQYDYVAARAVAALNVLAEYTLPFVRVGGLLVAQKGIDIEPEMRAAENALVTLGGSHPRLIHVPLSGLDRVLVVVDKTAPTPDRYPRAPGRPEKKPL